MNNRMNKANRNTEILNRLKNGNAPRLLPDKSSAVMIPLIEKNGEIHILFEERSHKLKFQPGDVCFPGGRIEKGETPEAAAKRELAEELFPREVLEEIDSKIEILCTLPPVVGPAGGIVYPFVCLLHDYKGTYSQDEVEQVITYPIFFFEEHPGFVVTMERHSIVPPDFPYDLVPGGHDYKWIPHPFEMWFYPDTKPVIWGFTARLLHRFLEYLDLEYFK